MKRRFLTMNSKDYFDVLDSENRPILTERDIHLNLQAIVSDADKTPIHEVARSAVGVLSTENRKVWNGLRKTLQTDRNNSACLKVVDDALFIVCLDDAEPTGLPELCSNFLCGTYSLSNGEWAFYPVWAADPEMDLAGIQVGTCTNRW